MTLVRIDWVGERHLRAASGWDLLEWTPFSDAWPAFMPEGRFSMGDLPCTRQLRYQILPDSDDDDYDFLLSLWLAAGMKSGGEMMNLWQRGRAQSPSPPFRLPGFRCSSQISQQ